MLYSTTPEFLEVFGLKDATSLPSLRELEQMIPGSQTGRPEEEDPRVREMRRLVSEMKADQSSALHYNPKEDEKILKEIRERVNSIPISTSTLDEMKAAELLAQQEAKQAALAAQAPQVDPVLATATPEKV
jgi:ABC-type Zn uptake system ZnuABC Zn-binding protein ZnuA